MRAEVNGDSHFLGMYFDRQEARAGELREMLECEPVATFIDAGVGFLGCFSRLGSFVVKYRVAAAVAVMVGVSAFGVSDPASAGPEDSREERVYVNSDYPFLDQVSDVSALSAEGDSGDLGGVSIVVGEAVEIDPSHQPEIGESLVVEYANAVSVIVTPMAGCTEKITAGKPVKSSGYARGKSEFSRSSGCSGSAKGDALSQYKNAIGAWVRGKANSGAYVKGGQRMSLYYNAKCRNSTSRVWQSQAGLTKGIDRSVVRSGNVTLKCTA